MIRTYHTKLNFHAEHSLSELRGPLALANSLKTLSAEYDPEENEPGEFDPTESTLAVAEEVVPEAVVRPTRETEAEKSKPKRQPRYHVLLWNDEEHSFEYVIKMLKELFGHQTERGMQLAVEVDTRGKAIVLTTTREHAELKRDQIHAYGKDDSIKACKGSMSSSIEPEVA